MNTQNIKQFSVTGISVRTTNENGQAAKDIPALWQRFMAEGIADKIPGRISNDIYCIYTDYEKDHTRPYTTIIGCRVEEPGNIPTGMSSKTIDEGRYILITAKGSLMEGIVFNAWTKIWNSDLPRIYTADYEVYGEKAQNPEHAEVEIFVAVK